MTMAFASASWPDLEMAVYTKLAARLSTAMMRYLCMLQANPTLPVVERLEDLWLLTKLQQERKAKEQQQQQQHHAGHQQAGKPLDPAAQQQRPQPQPVPSQVSSQTNARAGPQSAPEQQQEQTAGSLAETSAAGSMSAGFSSSKQGSGTATILRCSDESASAAGAAAGVSAPPAAAAALRITGPQQVPEADASSGVVLAAEQQPGDSSTVTGQCADLAAHGVAAGSSGQSDDRAIDAAVSDLSGGSSGAWLYELD